MILLLNILKSRPLFLAGCLAAAGYAQAGQQERFEMNIAPGGRAATVFAYVFDDRQETFRMAVRPEKENVTPMTLGTACKEAKALAGINGGFSDFQGEPLGLVMASGQKTGKVTLGSALTAGVVVCEGGVLSLRHSKDYEFSGTKATQLLQTGPFLIDGSKSVADLQSSRYARRSVILTDGAHKWAIAYFPSATLAGLSAALETPGAFKPFTPKTALNLDGGESSGFWTLRPGGYELYLKEIAKVRDFLLIVPRPSSPQASHH